MSHDLDRFLARVRERAGQSDAAAVELAARATLRMLGTHLGGVPPDLHDALPRAVRPVFAAGEGGDPVRPAELYQQVSDLANVRVGVALELVQSTIAELVSTFEEQAVGLLKTSLPPAWAALVSDPTEPRESSRPVAAAGRNTEGSGMFTVGMALQGGGRTLTGGKNDGSGARSLPSDGSGARSLPSDGSGARSLPSDGSGARSLPNDGSGARSLPNDGSGARSLPNDGSGARSLPNDGSGARSLPSDGSGARSLPGKNTEGSGAYSRQLSSEGSGARSLPGKGRTEGSGAHARPGKGRTEGSGARSLPGKGRTEGSGAYSRPRSGKTTDGSGPYTLAREALGIPQPRTDVEPSAARAGSSAPTDDPRRDRLAEDDEPTLPEGRRGGRLPTLVDSD